MEFAKDLKSRQEVRDLVEAADRAWEKLHRMDQQTLDRIVEAISRTASDHAAELAKMAVEETGFGNTADKTEKNRFASTTVWDAIREQKTVGVLRKDTEKRVWDVGVGVGVIAGIVPSTNPTSTIIYKTMIALKSGNAKYFTDFI